MSAKFAFAVRLGSGSTDRMITGRCRQGEARLPGGALQTLLTTCRARR
jgi:hypothetical protein